MHRNARILARVAAVLAMAGLASCGPQEGPPCNVATCLALLGGSMDSVVVEARNDSVVVEAGWVLTFQAGIVDSTEFGPGARVFLIRR